MQSLAMSLLLYICGFQTSREESVNNPDGDIGLALVPNTGQQQAATTTTRSATMTRCTYTCCKPHPYRHMPLNTQLVPL